MLKQTIAIVLLLGYQLWAQGPISDVLTVNLPQSTRVGDHLLAPGEYQIRQLPTASHPRLLEFASNNGTKIETAITTIAALDNNNVNETSVVLQNRGGEQVLRYVWIAGKSYGYEIPASGNSAAISAARDNMRMTASYTPAEPQTVAQNVTPTPEPAPAPTPKAEPEPEPVPAAAAPEPAPTPAPEPEQAVAQPAQEIETLPNTASNQAALGLAGLAMITAGLLIRRFTTQQ